VCRHVTNLEVYNINVPSLTDCGTINVKISVGGSSNNIVLYSRERF